ncbi:MAG: SDR family NAD(P)-dependent oxidoreductase [Aureliella sp.]
MPLTRWGGCFDLARLSAADKTFRRTQPPLQRLNAMPLPWNQTWKSRWNQANVVVCGASAGLGANLARRVALAEPASLSLIARRIAPLHELRDSIQKDFPKVEISVFAADACDRESLAEAAGHIESDVGGTDLCINAVGKSERGTILELSSPQVRECFEVNVVSALNCTQSFFPGLKNRNSTLVLIGSLASLFAPRFLGSYAIAKHGLAAFAQQARLELAQDQISVMLACPGPIARADAGTRYATTASNQEDSATIKGVPMESLQPGGGAKIKGLDPDQLADEILQAAAAGRKRLIRPRKAYWLNAIAAISPSLGDRILRSRTS